MLILALGGLYLINTPASHAATFGYSSTSSAVDHGGAGWMDVSGPYSVNQAISVTKLTGYMSGGGSDSHIRGLIYADNNGQPGAFEGVTTEVTVPANQSIGWVDMPFSSPVTLQPGGYWIGYWYADNNSTHYFYSVANSERYVQAAYSSTANPPSSYGSAYTSSSEYSIYATYTVISPTPSNTSPPAISGNAQQSQTLTTTTGSWTNSPTSYTYQWQDCDSSGANCASISGATSASYTLQSSDVNSTIRVIVTATNSNGSGQATSSATGVVLPLAPVNTGYPSVSGLAQQGQTLTSTNGSWSGSPTSYTYQWQDCDSSGSNCTNISGATSSSYVLQASDVGYSISLAVTASNAGGSATVNSIPTAVVTAIPVPVNTALPVVSGTTMQGQTLSTTNGSWSGSPTSYTYQWQDCDSSGSNCANISGATSSSYTLQASDVNFTIRAAVTASNAGGPAVAVSDYTSVVTAIPSPVNTALPVISGTATQGQTLTVSTGSWSGSPTSYAYQWQSCDASGANCSNISGAQTASYTLRAIDVNHTVRATVTATNQGGSNGATSSQTAVVAPTGSLPNGIAALGDSLTEAYMATGTAGDNPAESWSTGTDSAVDSIYQHILALNPSISGNNYNDAISGSPMSSTTSQADSAISQNPGLITIWSGTNDACFSPASAMTSVADYQTAFEATLSKLTSSLPTTHIIVLSLPDVYSLWQNLHNNPSAQSAWDTYNNRCPDVLSSTSTSADRAGVQQRIADFNNILATVCAQYSQCQYDDGAVFNLWSSLGVSDLAPDYFHLSVAGQAKVAAVVWRLTPYYNPPINTSPPAISGTAQQGQTLTTTTGSWSNSPTSYSYQWMDCDSSGSNCTNISGATDSSYILQASDVNSTIEVTVTATNSSGSGQATSSPTVAAIPLPAPVNTSPPVISGIAQQGQVLSVSNGAWANYPTSYSYQWQDCNASGANCSNISGANSSSYTIQASDVGDTIVAVVTATNTGGPTQAASSATAVVTSAVGAPGQQSFIRTNLPLGQYSQVTEGNNVGDINGDGKPDIIVAGDNYLVWYQNPGWTPHLIATGRFGSGAMVLAADINGNGRTDVVVGEEAGSSYQEDWFENTTSGWVKHIMSTSAYCHDLSMGDLNGDGLPDLACNDQQRDEVLWLQHPTDPTQAWTVHVIDNRWVMGNALADINGDGKLDIVAGEAWYDQATGFTRHPYTTMQGPVEGGGDYSNFEKINVLDINGDGRPDIIATMFAESPQAQLWAFFSPADPTTQPWQAVEIDAGPLFCPHSQDVANFDGSGRVQVAVGESDPGGWNFGRNPNTQLNIYEVVGDPTTSAGWQKTTVDNMSVHEMRVVDLNGDGRPDLEGEVENTNLLTPPQNGAVHIWYDNANNPAVAPTNSTVPQILGTATSGQTLTATVDNWVATGPITLTYQWLDCDTTGANCTPISGATAQTYTVASSDGGYTIEVSVTGTNSAGSDTITSVPTSVVPGGPNTYPSNTSPPAISGNAQQSQTLTTTTGSWTNSPTSYTYQWQDCDSSGANCASISGATSASYTLQSSDVNSTIRVIVTATNSNGSGQATSSATGVVTAQNTAHGTFGRTTTSSLTDNGGAGYMDVSGPYSVSQSVTVTKLTGYVSGGSSTSHMRAIIYADNNGEPGAFVAVSVEVTIPAGQSIGWVDFPLASGVTLQPGSYWIGYWYADSNNTHYFASVSGSERYIYVGYSSTGNPPANFGSANSSSSSYSLYATY